MSHPDMTKKTAAVLGSSGFIGSNLVKALASRGVGVKAFDKYPNGGTFDSGLVREVTGDFFNQGVLDEVLAGCDVCYHLVSTTLPSDSNHDPHFDAQSNICGSIQLMDAAVRRGVKKIVFASSGGTVYGPPASVPIVETHPTEPICSYGIAKLAIEKYLELYRRLHGLGYCCLRLANPYGPGQRINSVQGVVAVFLGRVLNDEPVEIWGDGLVVRDFVYIGDAVRALILASDEKIAPSVYNIGSGLGSSLRDILSLIAKVTGREVKIEYKPARKFDVLSNILDIAKAEKGLGWRPETALEDGLALTWASLTAQSN